MVEKTATTEENTEEKPLNEMTKEEILEIRKGIAAEEFEDNPPAEVEITLPEIIQEKETPADLQEQKKEEDDDKWAGVNPALRETLESLTAKVAPLDTFSTRLKQTESRLGAIQNEFYAAKKAAADAPKAPTAEEMAKAVTKKEEWENLKEEYPDWAIAMDGRLSEITEAQQTGNKQISQELSQISGNVDKKIAEITTNFEKRLLSFSHPGWETIIQTSEYQEWLKKQSNDIMQLTLSQAATDAITVLNAFEDRNKKDESVSSVANKRKQRLEQSLSVKGTKAIPPKSEDDMTDAELRKAYAKKIWA